MSLPRNEVRDDGNTPLRTRSSGYALPDVVTRSLAEKFKDAGYDSRDVTLDPDLANYRHFKRFVCVRILTDRGECSGPCVAGSIRWLTVVLPSL